MKIVQLSHDLHGEVGVVPAAAVRTVRNGLAAMQKIAFAALGSAPLPPGIATLLKEMPISELPKPASLSDDHFKRELAATMPFLRGYARSLSGNPDFADDLVQETMLKAWSARQRFIAGTNMRAWTHVILRNAFYSQARRLRFRGEWDPVAADLILAVPASQDAHIALIDLQRALMQLPIEQREAIVMMGAGGMSCEEVATICKCATGTVKSRVARGRLSLRQLLEGGQLKQHRADAPVAKAAVLDQIMQSAHDLAAPRMPPAAVLLPRVGLPQFA